MPDVRASTATAVLAEQSWPHGGRSTPTDGDPTTAGGRLPVGGAVQTGVEMEMEMEMDARPGSNTGFGAALVGRV